MAAASVCGSARWPAETLWLVQAFQAGGLTACERQPGDGVLVAARSVENSHDTHDKHLVQLAVALATIASVAVAPNTAMAAEGYYLQRNLVTNFRDKYRTRLEPGRKTLRNDLVLNAWGLALRPAGEGGHWWIANTDSGTVVTYVGDTDTTPLFQDALRTVGVEPAPATPEESPTPTGQVFSGSDQFPCSGTSFTGAPIVAPSRFLVVTEDGNLQCWAETGSRQAERMRSFTLAVNGESGSVYKGLAITPFSSGNRLYAANFGLRRIDAFDGAYQPILNGAFARPADVPEDFAPFNIQFLEYEIDGIARQVSSSPTPGPPPIRSRKRCPRCKCESTSLSSMVYSRHGRPPYREN